MAKEHRLDAIANSDRSKTVFCKICSAEGDDLNKPCPGKYVKPKCEIVENDRNKA